MDKITKAFQLFDEYNQLDPRRFEYDGTVYPQEYFFAIKLYEWVLKLDPEAAEALLLASRSQHIGRWESPRESYPEGRDAYLKWRKDLAQHHATISARLMTEAGYDDEMIVRVSHIIQKKRLKSDGDVQTMENALCLVFLQYQYEDFRKKYENDPEVMINILQRSLLKMDGAGHAFALELHYSNEGNATIQKALSGL